MEARLERIGVDLLGSADTYVDVLPAGVKKGHDPAPRPPLAGRRRAGGRRGRGHLNDLDLFDTGLRGIVVANCEPAFRERLGAGARVYFARGEGAAGVLEGLVHYGCLDGDHVG